MTIILRPNHEPAAVSDLWHSAILNRLCHQNPCTPSRRAPPNHRYLIKKVGKFLQQERKESLSGESTGNGREGERKWMPATRTLNHKPSLGHSFLMLSWAIRVIMACGAMRT